MEAMDIKYTSEFLAGDTVGLLRQLQEELGMGVIFVTHDLGVAAEIADSIAVMYAGRIVETGSVQTVLPHPLHPYTAAMLSSTVVGHKRGIRIAAIAGTPPDLLWFVSYHGFLPTSHEIPFVA